MTVRKGIPRLGKHRKEPDFGTKCPEVAGSVPTPEHAAIVGALAKPYHASRTGGADWRLPHSGDREKQDAAPCDPLQVCRRTGFTAQPCFAGECRSQQQTGRRNRISGWESRINEKRSSPFGLLLYIGMFSCVMNIQTGAGNRTWTCMKLPSLEPESSASANSAIPAKNGGQGWIRTIEVCDGRFTVCSLWPLGNLPIIHFVPNGTWLLYHLYSVFVNNKFK